MSDGNDLQVAESDPVVVPGGIVERFYLPSNAKEVAEVVAGAADRGERLLIAGGRTRLHWANPIREGLSGISLRGLSGVDEFEPEEGVLHAAAGTPIREIQEAARTEGWELALDPPGATSTLGGTIATAAMGPRSQSFGRVADAVLGLDVVGGDGLRSKCGGRVVKNVTGYDLAKLYCGSFGSLAVLCGAWLRLRPLSPVREAFVVRTGLAANAFEKCRSIGQRTSVRTLVWSERPNDGTPELVIELAGPREGVEHDRHAIEQSMDIEAISTEQVDAVRDARADVGSDSIVLRSHVLGSECQKMTRVILDAGLRVSVDLGLGMIHARGSLDQPDQLLAIRQQSGLSGGLTAIENLPDPWRQDFDVFDDQGDGVALAAVLKNRFDPSGLFNPGRFAGRV